MKHCCAEMDFHLNDGDVGVTYSPKFRQYQLDVKDGCAVQVIAFCPWCGTKLPENLWDEWCEIVIDELGFDLLNENIPDKYKTDAWWLSKEEPKKK